MNPINTNSKFAEYAVAGTAFFVSICSLVIYIYQSKLMAEQQQVAVWPYIQWSHSNIVGYQFDAENKGVGPAIVRKVVMSFNGQPVRSNGALVDAIMGPDWTARVLNGGLEGAVLSPGQRITFLNIPDKAAGIEFQKKVDAGKLRLEITYCSVYGRCWTSHGFSVTRTSDDKSTIY